MNKRRIRFNFIDLLLLLAIGAALFLLLYVFVLSGRHKASDAENTVPIEYVVEIQNIDPRFAEAVKRDQPVQDAIRRRTIGTVVGAEAKPYEKVVFDYESGEEVMAVTDGRITLAVTIKADVVETDSAFSADTVEIRVGEQYSLIFPEMYGVGFCTFLTKTEEP